MATISRITCAWSGFPGAPGFTNFYGLGQSTTVSPILTFFDLLKGALPSDVTITVPGNGDTIDDATGDLVGTWSATGGGVVVGTNGGGYAAPVGGCINWITGGINRAHKVRGRTYIVPMAGAMFQNDGSLTVEAFATLEGASASMLTNFGGDLVVWSRPRLGAGGAAFSISSRRVLDKAAVLRSRRD